MTHSIGTSSRHARRAWLGALLCASCVVASVAYAQSASTLYVYDLTNVQRDVPVPNLASTHRGVFLRLEKDYTPTAFGVRFEGNLVDKQSVGYAKPATGDTLFVEAESAVGVGARFRFASCSTDTNNIVQIGRAGFEGQVKLQLSKCRNDGRSARLQCRIAGERTPSNQGAVSSDVDLSPGVTYIAQCIKSPDPRDDDEAPIRLIVKPEGGSESWVDRLIPLTGAIRSTAYLSVANKYKLPSQVNNTDQFVGEIARVAFCAGPSGDSAKACLDASL